MLTELPLAAVFQEEWSVQLLPIRFLFLSASPVIVMRFVSKSGGKEYPPNVPVHATSLLLMEVVTDSSPCPSLTPRSRTQLISRWSQRNVL